MTNSENGVFINGKAQIVEMLQYMEPEERAKLINNIKIRNPQMALELSGQCISFKDLFTLSEHELSRVMANIQPAILGIALKGAEQTLQRKLLSTIDRHMAESAYEYLVKPVSDEVSISKRAQDKITSVLTRLASRKQISLFA